MVGPIAWDWPYEIDRPLVRGGVVQACRLRGRLGGTGANVARALASRLPAVSMVGYVGDDEWGERNLEDLRARGIDVEYVARWTGPTSQVMLLIEPDGERTIVGVVEDRLGRLRAMPRRVAPGDFVYFAAWREGFDPIVRAFATAGATVASVPFSPSTRSVPVSYVIGSMSELPDAAGGDPFGTYRDWTDGALQGVALTRGAAGVCLLNDGDATELPAVPTHVRDSTGAGDAFAAGAICALAEGRSLRCGVRDGLLWGSRAAASASSIPPAWSS